MAEQPIQLPIAGFIDGDTPNEVFPKGGLKYAKNVDYYGIGNNFTARNALGTRLVTNPYLPTTGTNVTIGTYFDEVNSREFVFNYNSNGISSIFIFNVGTETWQLLMQTNVNMPTDVLNFNPNNPITSIDILYGDYISGDILHFVDSLGRPTKINIQRYLANTYSSIKREYIDVAKAPPQMPPKVVYENDSTINFNNLNNKLFQFRQRFVYDDYEKSVFSAASEVPLPNQLSVNDSPLDQTKNNRIALYLFTGDVDVIKIEIAVRITENGVTSDWQLLDSLVKSDLSISNNTVYRYLFYNNSVLTPLTTEEQTQLFDYVPQFTNCAALMNGNTTIYGGITEGYDLLVPNSSVITTQTGDILYSSVQGVLFFGVINGIDSGSIGNQITFYFTGTGANDSNNNPISFDSQYVTLYNTFAAVNLFSGSTNLSAQITLDPTISTNITNLRIALEAKGLNFISSSTNSLTMSYSSNMTLYSTGLIMDFNSRNGAIPFFSYLNRANQQFGIVYFDDKGRTNGVITNSSLKVKFPSSPYAGTFLSQPMWCQIQINHRPPTWASYYQIVRSDDLTYSKILSWISKSSTSDVTVLQGKQYAYIGIDNISDYNTSIQATQGVVSYDFAQGDRVTIYGRYDSSNNSYNFSQLYDYEILGITTDPVINGVKKTGTFLKINYPTADIGTNLNFSDNQDYQNYKLFIYGIKEITSTTQTVFYEFGKCFGIGNSGTINAYHLGLEQTQSSDLVKPALISIINGDYFFRQRSVPIGNTYYLTMNSSITNQGFRYATTQIDEPNIITNNYELHYEEYPSNPINIYNATQFPTYADTRFFWNKSTNDIIINIQFTIQVTTDGSTSFDCYIKQNDSSNNSQVTKILASNEVLITNNTYQISVNQDVKILAGRKAFLIFGNTASVINMHLFPTQLKVSIVNNQTIPIFDASFSDVYSLKTNSNGRENVVDVNAKQAFNGSLLRWSRPRQTGTNINETNKFYELNYDEVARQYGDIMRLDVSGQRLHVFQKRKCGVKGIYNKYIKNTGGDTQLAVTDTILTQNNIEYYDGDFGINNQPSGLVKNGYVYYFPDDVRGMLCRLSQDGITPISQIYKQQTWAGTNIVNYQNNYNYQFGGYAKILGCWHYKTDKEGEYICVLQNGTGVTGSTIAFNEQRNMFTSFFDFNPDAIDCCNNKLISFYGGNLYIHDDENNRNKFYGTSYPSEITFVVNDGQNVHKEFSAIGYNASDLWTSDTIGDIQTSLTQNSNLVASDFYDTGESIYTAALWGDNNGNNGVIDGDYLKGVWMQLKLSINSSKFEYIQGVYCLILNSPKNF